MHIATLATEVTHASCRNIDDMEASSTLRQNPKGEAMAMTVISSSGDVLVLLTLNVNSVMDSAIINFLGSLHHQGLSSTVLLIPSARYSMTSSFSACFSCFS